MWTLLTRGFFLVTLALMVATIALTCAGIKGTGGFLTDELPAILWLATIGVLTLWVVATTGRLIARRLAKPRHADGPEADYHDPAP
jgi:hypothetical protein